MYTMCLDQVYPLYSLLQFFFHSSYHFFPTSSGHVVLTSESTQYFQYVTGATLSVGAWAASHMLFVLASLI